MATLGILTGTLVGGIIVLIIYGFIFVSIILTALGIFRAGTGFYQKSKNNTKMVLYNQTLNSYRDYSNLIFNYINLIIEDNEFDLNNPQYKEAHQKLRYVSGENVLFADDSLRTQISHFMDYSLAFSNNKGTDKNTDDAKQEFLKQLLDLQKAIKNHLDKIKPLTNMKNLKVY